MPGVVVIDREWERAERLADKVRAAAHVETFLLTITKLTNRTIQYQRTDAGNITLESGVPAASLVLHHYSDSARDAAMEERGVEVWYGAGGYEPDKGKDWNIDFGVTVAAVEGWDEDWLKELVEWAKLDSEERKQAAVPRLLNRPAPDALLAYHLLALLGGPVDSGVKKAAEIEVKAIAGANLKLDITDAKQRTAFIRKHC